MTLKSQYVKYKNLLHKLVNKVKISYFHNKITQYCYDQKKTWQTIREALNKIKLKI